MTPGTTVGVHSRAANPERARLSRAFRNVLGLALLLAGPATLAVSPPRPGSHARLPEALQRWEARRPAIVLDATAKSGAGTVRALVLPAGFADLAGRTTTSDLQAVFTGPRSVRDYWRQASDDALTVTGEVSGWQRAPGTRENYAGDHNGLDIWAAPHNAGRFVHDAVVLADKAGLDWGRYDDDGPDGVPNSGDDDGVVDALIVVHAGPGGECGTADLWSHQYSLAGWGYGTYATRTPRPGGGRVQVDQYVLVPERSCDGGVIEIGVICHEFGHLLGLPDLYDTAGGRAGIGGWGLMGTGGWGGDGQRPDSPSLPCAWSRVRLGWADAVAVRADGPQTIAAGDVLSVRDAEQPPGERWLLANRSRDGFDASLPAAGLLIWHVDDAVIAASEHLNAINAGDVLGVALEQADGLDHLTRTTGGNRGDAGDPWPGLDGRDRFVGHDNAGAATAVQIADIAPPAATVTMGVPHLDVTPPTVTVLAPAAGADLTLGDLHTVAWVAADDEAVAEVDLWLSDDGGTTWPRRLAQDLVGVDSWRGTLATAPGAGLRVRVVARDAAGNRGSGASGVFALCDRYAPGVAFTSDLAAGQQLRPGETVLVSWESADNVAVVAVDLELSCDGGLTWQSTALVDQMPSAVALAWTVPDLACGQARLRAAARDAAGNVGRDAGDTFAILGSTTGAPPDARPRLGPCVPNPFNPRAEIRYLLAVDGHVQITVHDLRGRQVCELVAAERPAGPHAAVWDGRDAAGRDVASGVYYVRAITAHGTALLKTTLVR